MTTVIFIFSSLNVLYFEFSVRPFATWGEKNVFKKKEGKVGGREREKKRRGGRGREKGGREEKDLIK